ncbi:hypothetical protein [Ideonella oryzae]|uniref:Uncharacterized protein n=1 Tax=Ideonella oryzae TaxID=2937441 RepID=A0ABT1BM49_9BURK|nr:hypothetical protein [Ideonella oryzae]MCO5977280.1 hypothetical protein [Ideonella oryzae]
MPETAIDPLAWLDELPADYAVQVVPPIRYESHEDAPAHARMVVGLDAQGQRCYLRHTHTVTEDRFDIDEFPLEVAVLRERRIAWRLSNGQWLTLLDRADRLDSCRPRVVREGPHPAPSPLPSA